jgi:hypothetical protein
MLKELLASILPSRGGDDEAQLPRHRHHGEAIDADKLRLLVEYFPIGKKLRYYPEFQREIVFDTLVVGYCANGHFVYSRDAVEVDGDGKPLAFHADGTAAVAAARLRQFLLLVPDTSDLEMTLDYYRRAMIGRARQFLKGNAISLIANAGARGVSTVDTRVDTPVVLKDGPYAGNKMVLLEPELHTLDVADQRQKTRARTRVAVGLYAAGARQACPCVLLDFSDASVRLRVGDGQPAMPEMQPDDEVTLAVDLGEAGATYSIQGAVIRRTADACVVRLDRLYKDYAFIPFSRMDLFEFKAGLLNFGK